jgi:hypothetical protein
MQQLFYRLALACKPFMVLICMEWTGVVNYMFILTRFSATDLSVFLSGMVLYLYAFIEVQIHSGMQIKLGELH